MLEFRKHTNKRSAAGSVDGFVAQNRASITQPKDVLNQTASKEDGFTSSNAELSKSEKRLVQAIESRGSLPTYGLAASHQTHALNSRKKPRIKRVLKGFGVAGGMLAVCGLIVIGFVFGKAWLAAHKIFQGGGSSNTLFNTDISPNKLKGEGDGRVNVLLTGIGGGDRAGAYLTDTIIIASIDPVAKDVALLSIPRDLWVKVPDFWSMKINAAFNSARELALENGSTDTEAEEAGFRTLESVIEENIGVPIHYHALVNFEAFKEGVDSVGGVDVDVKEDLYDNVLAGENDWDPLIAKQGFQHFDGRLALLYAQSRSSSSDFARGERQRAILIALKEKVVSANTFSNPRTISSLLDALGDNITINASLNEILRMYEIIKDIPSTSIVTVGFTDEPNILVTTDSINDQSIVRPRAGLTDFSEIQGFVRNTLRDPYLRSENASIAVLNGTTQDGIASAMADELKSYGYNVTLVDDAPTKDYTSTVLYDRSQGLKKYTKNFIERRIGVVATEEPQGTNPILVTADFIIVLGQNETNPNTN